MPTAGPIDKATNQVATRVPLIVSAPKMAAADKGSRALVEFVDVYPSLCELAGLSRAARPLSPAMRGTFFGPVIADVEAKLKQKQGEGYNAWLDRRAPNNEPLALRIVGTDRVLEFTRSTFPKAGSDNTDIISTRVY